MMDARSSAPARAVVLTPQWQGADGVSSYTRSTVAALAAKLPVEVWSLHESGPRGDRPAPPNVACRWAGGSKRRLAGWALRRALRNCADTVFLATHLGLSPALLPLRFRGGTTAVMLLGIEAWRPLAGLDARALRGSRLGAISQFTADGFRQHNPAFAAKPIAVVHLCLDLPPALSAAPAATESFALLVARISADERYKGHDQMLEAWPEVQSAAPTAKLLVAGDGDDRPRLEAKAAAAGLGDAVRFLGRVSDARLAELYEQCRFFAMPSPREGFGLVFLEAMRAGKPCLGCPGSASEIIVEGETGFLVRQDDRPALVERLALLFADAALRGRLGAAGRRREAETFSPRAFEIQLGAFLGLAERPCSACVE